MAFWSDIALRVSVALVFGLAASPGLSEQIDVQQLETLPFPDVVVLGEIHDNPAHHLLQASALRAMQPKAVVFEMLDGAQAQIVNRLGGDAPELGGALDWASSGWPDFTIYAPVFEAVGSAQVYGMALPRADVRRAVTKGAAAVIGADRAERFALDRPLPETERIEREANQMRVHCDMLPPEIAPGMVEAQRLRDAVFAEVILKALEDTGGPVAVVAGSGHARTDWGIPAAIARAAPEVRVMSIGQVEDGSGKVDEAPYDLWLVADPVTRSDPCAALSDGDGG